MDRRFSTLYSTSQILTFEVVTRALYLIQLLWLSSLSLCTFLLPGLAGLCRFYRFLFTGMEQDSVDVCMQPLIGIWATYFDMNILQLAWIFCYQCSQQPLKCLKFRSSSGHDFDGNNDHHQCRHHYPDHNDDDWWSWQLTHHQKRCMKQEIQ